MSYLVDLRPTKKKGVVRWFNDQKGHGFITPDGGGRDVFVHHTEINIHGYKTLHEAQRVEFYVVERENGPTAKEVTPEKERLVADSDMWDHL